MVLLLVTHVVEVREAVGGTLAVPSKATAQLQLVTKAI